MSTTNIRIKKVCEFCGAEFEAQKVTTRYCSKRCSERAYKKRQRIQLVESNESADSSDRENQSVGAVNLREYLEPKEVAVLLGMTSRTVYNLIYRGQLKAAHLSNRMTLIRKSDVEAMIAGSNYQIRHKSSFPSVEEWYTTKEIIEKFGVSNSWVFEAGKKEGIPKVMKFGRTYWSKSHCDRVFAKKQADPEITEWYTAAEMKEKFGMTDSAIWNFVSKKAIPKKKVGGVTYYSKRDVDIAKGLDVPDPTIGWYTYAEAMEKYGLTHDQVCHYLKTYKIKKVEVGKFTKFSREEFDNLLAPPIL